MLQRRNSKQRNVLREYLRGRTDHPTAETLYKEIQVQYPRMSLGTVYRNLMLLSDSGEIQALDVGDGKTHFDPNPEPHAHFYCTKCKQVSDIFFNEYGDIINIIKKNTKGSVTSCSISVEGICPICKNQDE